MNTPVEDAVGRYRLRAVHVAVQTTLYAVLVLAAYPLLDGGPDVETIPYLALLVMAGGGALAMRQLPWERILLSAGGLAALYLWSALDIALITWGLTLTGGATSSVFWLYVLTTLFFAATYPRSGQVALLVFTAAVYLVLAAHDGVSAAELSMRMAVLFLTAFMATFLSAQLQDEIAGHVLARSESEHRASLLATVADAARSMSTVDNDRMLETVVGAAVAVGFDSAELCLYDDGGNTWRQAYHQGLLIDGYETVQPIGVGLAGRVFATERTVVEQDYASWDEGVAIVRDFGLGGTVACPVWSAGELAGVLIAGRRDSGVGPSEVECLELLAAQAGAALVVTRRYAERQSFEQELRFQANHDPLTGLPNRTLLMDRIDHAIRAARRNQSTVAALFVDLDGFKTINDSLGHEAGDALLRLVSDRLLRCVRPGDTLARYGGDEFAVILEDGREDSAVRVAERILDTLRDAFPLAGRDVVVTASIGISLSHGATGDERPDPIRDADLAMYRAKGSGGGRWSRFALSMDAEALERLDQESDLRRAVRAGEFHLVYQPVVDLASGRMTGVEALVRWDHPTRGPVPPVEFIPVAERTGLIISLGRWVLEEACRQVRAWQDAGLDIHVAVNLSAVQFDDADLVAELATILRRHDVHPGRLVLEVTESVFIDDPARAVATMAAIGELGVSFALDDFGQGYSSLSYLKVLPLQVIKIDRSFVVGLAGSAADQAIVRAVVGLASELGMSVLAEGVETFEQLAQVSRLGCASVQGFLFSRPVLPAAIVEMADRPVLASPRLHIAVAESA